MRIHQVERFHDDFERLHARLWSELIILPRFPEVGRIASILGGFFGNRVPARPKRACDEFVRV